MGSFIQLSGISISFPGMFIRPCIVCDVVGLNWKSNTVVVAAQSVSFQIVESVVKNGVCIRSTDTEGIDRNATKAGLWPFDTLLGYLRESC